MVSLYKRGNVHVRKPELPQELRHIRCDRFGHKCGRCRSSCVERHVSEGELGRRGERRDQSWSPQDATQTLIRADL